MPSLWWVELGLVPLVDRAMSSGVFWGVCQLSMTLASLSADGWGCFPVLLVVWPEAFQHWSLQAFGWGQVLVPNEDLLEISHRLIFPGASDTSVLAPWYTTANPHPPRRPSKTPR